MSKFYSLALGLSCVLLLAGCSTPNEAPIEEVSTVEPVAEEIVVETEESPGIDYLTLDTDGDGTSNLDEINRGSDPLNACDSGCMQLLDNDEDWYENSIDPEPQNPCVPDPTAEACGDPSYPSTDTDGDGTNDADEIANGSNPLNACDFGCLHSLDNDEDWYANSIDPSPEDACIPNPSAAAC